jgi:hypothetical protein
VLRRITVGQRVAWAPASRWAASRPFSRARGRHLDHARLLAHQAGRRPLYKAKQAVVFLLLLSLFHRRRLAPPLTTVAVELLPATQTAPSHSPRPHAPLGPTALAFFFHPNHRTTVSFSNAGDRAPLSRLRWPALSTVSQCLLVASLQSL